VLERFWSERKKMNTKRTVLLCVCLFVFACVAVAQVPTATLVGQVTDPTKAALVKAKVSVRDMANNQVRTAETGPKGEYTVSSLLPGRYEVTITQTGFRELVESNLELSADQTARLDATLEVGSEKTVVDVSESVGAVNTETSSKGDVIAPVEIAEMPLNGRDFNDLAFSIAGVQPSEEGGKGTSWVVNGARSDSNSVLVDGINNTNPRDAGAQATPPLDSLQEFKMQTSGYSAEYGRVAGASVNMVMKRGGNQLHGSVFEYLRNDMLDARSYFDSTDHKSELRRNQFGATLGGPVVIPKIYNGHDHTFFFASWESFREVAGKNVIGTVPTLLERQGDFSQSFNTKTGNKLCPTTVPCSTLKDPLTGGVGIFANNVIPHSLMNPNALSMLNFYPTPNRSGPNNYKAYGKNLSDWDSFVIKIDQQLSGKDELSARFLVKQATSTDPFSGSETGLWGSTTDKGEKLIGVSETHIFSNTVINEFRLGLTRAKNNEVSLDGGTNWASMLGMQGTTNDPNLAQFPLFKPTGYMTLGDSTQNPIRYTTNNYNLNDVLTWNKGKHTVKFGGDILRVQYFQPTNSNFSGTLSFSGQSAGNSIAEFLRGVPSSVSLKVGTVTNHIYDTSYAGFVQDDFKALPNLTLNLGVRYELQTMPHEKDGQFSTFVPSLNKVILASDKDVPNLADILAAAGNANYIGLAKDYDLPQTLIHPNYKRVAPRVGFAWRPFRDTRTVLRGGYGIFYTGSRLSAIRTELSGQFPFSITENFSNKGVLTLANPFDSSVMGYSSSGVTSVNGYDVNAKSPYLQSWNLTVERELGKGVVAEVGYTGSKGTHLGRQIDINQVSRQLPGTTCPAGWTSVAASSGTVPNEVDCRPFAYFGNIKYFSFNSNSSYNAGTITIRKRFDHGLFFRANYTYGKSLDTASGLNYSGNGGYKMAQNSYDPNAERGRSDFDMRHVFSMNFVYKLPINKTVVLRGWQLAGSGTIYSGTPFTPQLSGPTQDKGLPTRPNRVCSGNLSNPTPEMWFDLSCFPQVDPSTTVAFGDSGRNILNGPGNLAINLALSRNFKIRENGRLQFRWEVFNVTNHTNFNLPNDNVDEPGAGTITSAKPNRVMQLGARYQF
jgi:hypothetical protein